MGELHVHEFISLDGVIDAPTWTFEYGFDPEDGRGDRRGHRALPGDPAGTDDLRDVRAGLVDTDRGGRSRGSVLQRHHQVRRLRDADRDDVAELRGGRAVRPRRDPRLEGRGRAISTSRAAARSSGRCSRTALSTSCTCSSTRSPAGQARGSSPRTPRPRKLSLAANESYENGVTYLAYRPLAAAEQTV